LAQVLDAMPSYSCSGAYAPGASALANGVCKRYPRSRSASALTGTRRSKGLLWHTDGARPDRSVPSIQRGGFASLQPMMKHHRDLGAGRRQQTTKQFWATGDSPLEREFRKVCAGHELRLRVSRQPICSRRQQFATCYESAYSHVNQQRQVQYLEKLFQRADADGSGMVTLDEFRMAMRDEEARIAFAELGFQPHETERLFQQLDTDGGGEIDIKEFMSGLLGVLGQEQAPNSDGNTSRHSRGIRSSLDPSVLQTTFGYESCDMSGVRPSVRILCCNPYTAS